MAGNQQFVMKRLPDSIVAEATPNKKLKVEGESLCPDALVVLSVSVGFDLKVGVK